tara:strand:- start:878 stop:1066 length:189 start_codon:yes stop_codon:yes gene_type:complete
MNKFIQDKYKNVSAISFKAYHNELLISFSGFEEEEDIYEFCEFVFNKIKMNHNFTEGPPTIH